MSTTVDQVPPAWIAQVREIVARDGLAVRAGSVGGMPGDLLDERALPVIEVQNMTTGNWQPLNLPTNITAFATAADRDTVLAQLWREKK